MTATQTTMSPAELLSREALHDLIARHLGDTYHCTRVWSAWRVGTMSESDFEPVDESDTPWEIADAILPAVAALIEREAALVASDAAKAYQIKSLMDERDALAERVKALEAENLHLAKFIGPSAMPWIKASLAAGLPAGGADQPLARAEARNG